MTTTPTPKDNEMRVCVKSEPCSEVPKVSRAEALKMSRTPARMPMTRKGRTGNVDDRKWANTVWAISSRMMTTSIPSIAATTVWGKPLHWRKKVKTVLEHRRSDNQETDNDQVLENREKTLDESVEPGPCGILSRVFSAHSEER